MRTFPNAHEAWFHAACALSLSALEMGILSLHVCVCKNIECFGQNHNNFMTLGRVVWGRGRVIVAAAVAVVAALLNDRLRRRKHDDAADDAIIVARQ